MTGDDPTYGERGADRGKGRPRVAPSASSGEGMVISAEGQFARALYVHRRRREQIIDADLFGEPLWDMLLDLFASQEEGRRVYVRSLCVAALVPTTTALRWIATMVERGLFIRRRDEQDARRVWIELSSEMAERMRLLLRSFGNRSG